MNMQVAVMAIGFVSQLITPMDRAAGRAELFWDQFTGVQCVERVTQSRLRDDGRTVATQTREFDYVVLLKPKAQGVSVEESRVNRSAAVPDQKDTFLLTSGFPAFVLLFHPDLRDKFEFQESASADVPAGTARMAFKSKPDEHSMSALKVGGKFYPILWKGFAWIDERTGNITRIEASLASPMDDIGLSALHAEVQYKEVSLRDTGLPYQLPLRVTIDVHTPRQHWRNVHEFSGYKQFSVTTSTQREDEKGRP